MRVLVTGAAARLLWPLAATLLLAACAAPQGGRGVRAPAADAGAGAGASVPAGAPSARGGGYYLDDGPGADAPADLASIPDAVPRAETLLPRTLRPYSVFGRQYTPMTRIEPFRERGTASWYGRRYHGQPTSSGERYDMYAMTAAHPTLPIPSYVRVTHTANGRSVVVRVNDRGPFLHDRVIDLSYTAAAKLGYVASGSAEVDVELVTRFDGAPAAVGSPEATGVTASADSAAASARSAAPRLNLETVYAAGEPAAAADRDRQGGDAQPAVVAAPAAALAQPASQASTRGFWLQFGAFGTQDGARGAMAQLARRLDWLGAAFAVHQEGTLHKVQAGPWPRREQAVAVAERIRAATGLRSFATLR